MTLSILLREAYGQSLDWSVRATPRRGDSPVVAGIRWIFSLVQSFFRPQLGDGASFLFWVDDWSGLGRLCVNFPRLYALAPDPPATVRTMWTDTWTPILPQVLSDQRLADFTSLQISIINLRPLAGTQDAWIWRHSRFSIREVYRLLLETTGSNSCLALPGSMEATASAKDPYLRLATFAPSTDDESHMPSHGSRSSCVLPPMCWGGRGLSTFVFHVPDSTGSVVGGGGRSFCCVIGRGVLELPDRRLL